MSDMSYVVLCNFNPALVADHKSVHVRLTDGFNNLDVVAEDASFDTDFYVLNFTVTQDDTVFDFRIPDLCPVADGSERSDITVFNNAIFSDDCRAPDYTVDDGSPFFDDSFSGNR